MKKLHHGRAGMTLMEAVIVLAVILILAALVLPDIGSHPPKHWKEFMRTLSNGRQLHAAAERMASESDAGVNPSRGWPGDIAGLADVGDYVERLVRHGYLDREQLGRLFAAPGMPRYSGNGDFESKYSGFKVYRVTKEDGPDTLLFATRNFRYGDALDPKSPYSEIGCVVVRKGGDAMMLSGGQAQNKNIGMMPGGTIEHPGEEEGSTLKD
ncbi:MAG TPA: type II secretion system protein [Chthoniobacteraceae bacterium]|jgi:type II secretory pathway pseudopilin PulG|nr:type II secretion system protein [Chthoniobacteraceae bacterium]